MTPSPNNYRPASLVDRKGDISKRWYVEFYALNTVTGKLQRSKPIYCPTKYKTAKERRQWAKTLCHDINKLLVEGFAFNEAPVSKRVPHVPVPDAPIAPAQSVLLPPTTLLEGFARLHPLRQKTHRDRTSETNIDTINIWKHFIKHLKEADDAQLSDLASLPIDGLTAGHIDAFSDYILLVRQCSNRRRNNLLADLQTQVNLLAQRGWLPPKSFPAWELLPVDPSRIHDVYTAEHRATLLDYLQANDHRLYFFVQMVYYTYLRPVELCRLRVRDVDLPNNQIRLHVSAAKGGRKSTGFEVVVIPLSLQEVIDKLNLHLANPDDYVFGEKMLTGPAPIIRNRVSERHAQALKDVGLYNKVYTLYGHKHSGVRAKYLVDKDILWLQRQLRHASLDDTMIYLRSLGLLPPDRGTARW